MEDVIKNNQRAYDYIASFVTADKTDEFNIDLRKLDDMFRGKEEGLCYTTQSETLGFIKCLTYAYKMIMNHEPGIIAIKEEMGVVLPHQQILALCKMLLGLAFKDLCGEIKKNKRLN